MEGSIIICTKSGHVFVRTRNTKNASAKAFKFEQVPFLQRVTHVCANSTGAFGALKVDFRPKPIAVTGNTIAQDLKRIQPYLQFYREEPEGENAASPPVGAHSSYGGATGTSQHADDEPEDEDVEGDIASVLELCRVLACEQRMRRKDGGNVDYSARRLPHGADMMVHLHSGEAFPAHRAVIAARSHILTGVLLGGGAVSASPLGIQLLSPRPGNTAGIPSIARLSVSNAHPLAILILLHYLYSDELLAVWDRRIGRAVHTYSAALGADTAQVRADLQALALLLELPTLSQALAAPVRRTLPPTMAGDMEALFDRAQTPARAYGAVPPDTVLQFADRDIYTHSVVLRARSPLFASFFDLEDWSAKRWDADGKVRINMKHLTVHVMGFVVRFMCCGADEELFRCLGAYFENLSRLGC